MHLVLGLLGSLLFFVALLVLWIVAAREDRRRKEIESVTLYCSRCEAANEGAARFCGECGSDDLMGIEDFRRLEEVRVKERSREREQTARRDDAIRRIAELRGLAYCRSCEMGYGAGVVFCTKCGADVADSLWPDDRIYDAVHEEYPDVVGSVRCYERLRDAVPSGPRMSVLSRGFGEAFDHVKRTLRRG